MCFSKPSVPSPPPVTPPPPPPPPAPPPTPTAMSVQPAPTSPEASGIAKYSRMTSARKGKGSLTIPLTIGGGSGISTT